MGRRESFIFMVISIFGKPSIWKTIMSNGGSKCLDRCLSYCFVNKGLFFEVDVTNEC